MKRFLSMALALALVLTSLMVPAYAEDAAGDTPAVDTPAVDTPAVDITSIKDGETVVAGANLKLAADASTLAEVKNIDFYANGAKLPGTIVGAKGEITWYSLAEGVYDVTTKVTYNGGAVADGGETVRVVVLPAADDLHMLWPGNYGITIPGATESTDYAIYGKSAAITLNEGTNTITIDMKDTVGKSNGDTGILIYSPEAIEGVTTKDPTATSYNNNNCMRMKLSVNGRTYNNGSGGHTGIAKGFNKYVASGFANNDKDAGKYFDKLWLRFYNVPEGGQTIYLCGIYEFVNKTPVTPVATAALDGKADVCNAVGTFRIDLSTAVFPYYGETAPVTVKKVDGETKTDVEIKGYKVGTDYVDVYLNTLELESQYEVSLVENTLIGVDTANSYDVNNTMIYVPANTFAFSTKATDCLNATPVIQMTYPADGATCVANTGFAAKVVAGSSAITGIEFWKGETKLGDGVAMSDGEYWFQPAEAALTVGEASEITVKAVGTDVTASATYTGAAMPDYFVKGIYDGKVFVSQEGAATITVVDSAKAVSISEDATNISKVEFYIDDALVDTVVKAPYKYNFAVDTFATDKKFEARIYDVFGNVHSKVFSYDIVDGVLNPASYDTIDFENYTASTTQDTLLADLIQPDGEGYALTSNQIALSVDETAKGSKTLKIEKTATADNTGYVQFKSATSNTGYKVHVYEFNLWATNAYTHEFRVDRDFGWNQANPEKGTVTLNTLFTNKNFYVLNKQGTKVKVVVDYNYDASVAEDCPTAVVSVGGKEYKKVDLTNAKDSLGVFQIAFSKSGEPIYIDNLSYKVYDIRPEYAVKGIYDGATMVKEEEATRKITIVNKADSSKPTTIKTVELYKDGELVATSGTETPNVVELRNDAYGSFDLEVKVTDIYGQVHPFTFEDCEVVEGVKNTEYSVDLQTFEDVADEDLAGLIDVNRSAEMTLTTEKTRYTKSNKDSDGKALKIGATIRTTQMQLSAPLNSGRKVHYYNFDLAMNTSYTKGLYIYGDGFDEDKSVKDAVITDLVFPQHNSEYSVLNVGLVLDYSYEEGGAPVATIYLDGSEYKCVELPNAITGSQDPVLVLEHDNLGGYIYIDNFKYSVYDYPSRYGFGEFEDTIVLAEPTGSKDGAPIYTGRQRFTTKFTNTTNADVTVKYCVVTYKADGRMNYAYQTDDRLDKADGLTTSWTVTYPAGSIDAENTFKLNIGEAGENWTVRLYGFVVGENNVLDLAPIKLYE